MAFNPFHHFRRYSKVVFAALAILCMFTFVLSSGLGGRGDLLQRMAEWAGTRSGSSALLTVAGHKYDAHDVDQVRLQRRLASEYMELATGLVQNNLMAQATNGIQKIDPSARRIAEMVLQARLFGVNLQTGQRYEDWLRSDGMMYLRFLSRFAAQANQENKLDDVRTLNAITNLVLMDLRRLGREPGEGYFGGQIERDADYEYTANFLVWEH